MQDSAPCGPAQGGKGQGAQGAGQVARFGQRKGPKRCSGRRTQDKAPAGWSIPRRIAACTMQRAGRAFRPFPMDGLDAYWLAGRCRRARHSRFAAVVALAPFALRRRLLGFHTKPHKGHCPVGLIVVHGTALPCTRQTSHLGVARRCAALSTGQTLPFDAQTPQGPSALDPF